MVRNIYYFPVMVLVLASVMSPKNENMKSSGDQPVPVSHVDLRRYVGNWYEIARIPNFFESKCAMNATVTYVLQKDNEIGVVNQCFDKDGKAHIAKGIAKVVDQETCAKLKVSFVKILGVHLFWGDYWIIGLDKDYRYAVVGTPSRKYGWILSRTPKLSSGEFDKINEILRNQGYNPSDFVPTPQMERDSTPGK